MHASCGLPVARPNSIATHDSTARNNSTTHDSTSCAGGAGALRYLCHFHRFWVWIPSILISALTILAAHRFQNIGILSGVQQLVNVRNLRHVVLLVEAYECGSPRSHHGSRISHWKYHHRRTNAATAAVHAHL
jgi:hypothetical protein